jgi:ABC-type transporter Mla subunit MlaD
VPGEYTVTLRAAGKQLSKSMRLSIDPRVQLSEAELAAQLAAGLELRSLSSRLNEVVARLDDLSRQLTTLADTLKRSAATEPQPAGDRAGNGQQGGSGPRDISNGVRSEVSAALDDLKKLRATLVREGTFSYRYAPKLREEVNSLLSSISNPIAPPTEAQMLRLREVSEETAKAVADLNAIINGPIKRVNDRVAAQPHIATGALLR